MLTTTTQGAATVTPFPAKRSRLAVPGQKVLLVNCAQRETEAMTELLGDEITLFRESEKSLPPFQGFDLAVVKPSDDGKATMGRIKQLRRAARFRDLPILVISDNQPFFPKLAYKLAGATEELPLLSSPARSLRVLQGYLAPRRMALSKERDYLFTFIQHTKKLMKMTALLDVEFQTVYFCRELNMTGDVSGVVGLTGSVKGVVMITFYWDFARRIIARTMGVEPDDLATEVICDGIGGLINNICGYTEKSLADTPYSFKPSQPAVVVGSGYGLEQPDDTNVAVLVFEAEDQAFALQIALFPQRLSPADEFN